MALTSLPTKYVTVTVQANIQFVYGKGLIDNCDESMMG